MQLYIIMLFPTDSRRRKYKTDAKTRRAMKMYSQTSLRLLWLCSCLAAAVSVPNTQEFFASAKGLRLAVLSFDSSFSLRSIMVEQSTRRYKRQKQETFRNTSDHASPEPIRILTQWNSRRKKE